MERATLSSGPSNPPAPSRGRRRGSAQKPTEGPTTVPKGGIRDMGLTESTLGLVAALVPTFTAARIGSSFPVDEWYAELAKPAWNPPNWVFGPVWGVLYLLMAIAAWLVWRWSGFAGAAIPLGAYVLQLGLNAAWSWFFFGRHELGLAFIEIVLLWGAILGTIIGFWRLNPISGILLVPYLLWVTFAAFLNFTIWRLNR